MNDLLRDRILRRIETLSDERGYQVLDYVEFLESKYAERKPASPNVFQRFAEGVEDTMRAGKVSASAVAQTMGLMSQAMNVLNGAAAAGKSVASDIVGGVKAAGKALTDEVTASTTAATPASVPPTPASPTPPAAPPADPPKAG